ncbi:hypothetical protein BTJ40_16815 [Microbulbifer sp. A4B17]|nr:hypothetical protein BTJ40_16815 [Microbulbifer sp. A4B17]
MSKDDRTAVVDRMNRIDDRKNDTTIGKEYGRALLTMVKGKTLITVIIRLTSKRSDLMTETAASHIVSLKNEVKTITFGNGP